MKPISQIAWTNRWVQMDFARHYLKLGKEIADLTNIELKDSAFNVKKINEIANMESTYQVDKQARLDSLNQVQAEIIRLEEEKQAKYLSDRKNAESPDLYFLPDHI